MASALRVAYLIQGQAENLPRFADLKASHSRSIFRLTYDHAVEGADFFPNSTWAEGRNRLLSTARSAGNFDYYVFCDDDVLFKRGNWDLLEAQLKRYQPDVAVPVFYPKTRRSVLPGFAFQSFEINDEQLLAVRHNVIEDGLLFPYQTHLDSLSWWAACEIQEVLIQSFYQPRAIQLNQLWVENAIATRYEVTDEGQATFGDEVRRWLAEQFSQPFTDRRPVSQLIHRFPWVIIRSLRFFLGRRHDDSEKRRREVKKLVATKLYSSSIYPIKTHPKA